jgi:hypothetical protein
MLPRSLHTCALPHAPACFCRASEARLQLRCLLSILSDGTLQAELVRAALWTPDLDSPEPISMDKPLNPAIKTGVVGMGATRAGAAEVGAGGCAKMLDHRKVGVRALDWKFSFQVRRLRVCLLSSPSSAHASADPRRGGEVGDSAESGAGGDSCWLAAEVGDLESEWMQWSDTCLQSRLSLAGASIRQADDCLDPDQQHLANDLLLWGATEDATGLEVKIDSDGHGEEHRFDIKSAPLFVNLAPDPVSLPLCHTCLQGNGPSVHQHRAALQRHRAVACSDATTPCRCTASES